MSLIKTVVITVDGSDEYTTEWNRGTGCRSYGENQCWSGGSHETGIEECILDAFDECCTETGHFQITGNTASYERRGHFYAAKFI